MPVLRINAQGKIPVLHGAARPLRPVLEQAVSGHDPIVILLHGYKFLPHDPKHCPHQHIFAQNDRECRKALSWPKHLGMADDTPGAGLAIAFGWNARGSLWQAKENARCASIALATLIRFIRRATPERSVHVMAHSMGGYLASQAMKHLNPGDLGRMIILNGALYRSEAEAALDTPAGQTAEWISVVSRENAIYDAMFEYVLRPERRGDRVIGRTLNRCNAMTVDLSDPSSLEAISRMGYRVGGRNRRHCHWSTYLRPGIFSFYQALLRRPEETAMMRLKSSLHGEVPVFPVYMAPRPLPNRLNRA